MSKKMLAMLGLLVFSLMGCEQREEEVVVPEREPLTGQAQPEAQERAEPGMAQTQPGEQPAMEEQAAQEQTAQQPQQSQQAGQIQGQGQEQKEEFYGQSPQFEGIQETIVLQAKNGNVTLPHKAHAKLMDCSTCHPGEPGDIAGFSKDQAHALCIGCHKEKNAGPTKCQECHKKS